MGNVYRAQGQLAVSRSLGNFNIKNVISNEPEVSEHAIEPDDVALVLGTDGLWNVKYIINITYIYFLGSFI